MANPVVVAGPVGSSGELLDACFELRVQSVHDLIASRELTEQPPNPLTVEVVSREIQSLLGRDELTLTFLSPLRLERRGQQKRDHETFFNRHSFEAHYFAGRLLRRMATVGVLPRSGEQLPIVDPSAVRVIENRLVWLDLAYGGPFGKSLGGAVGRVRLKITPGNDLLLAALAWGQWTRVGKNTSFGFGRYRIEELGAEPFACPRAVSLLNTAWAGPLADRLSTTAGLEAGVLSQTIRDIAGGTYEPHVPAVVEIGVEPKRRQLRIPSRRDRVLQRLVLEQPGPALDSIFETSSFAWRRGLGRHSSAKEISKAFRQGYRYAVNSDFDRFFDTIDHSLLEDRLRAYVSDAATVDLLLLQWVRATPTETGIQPASGFDGSRELQTRHPDRRAGLTAAGQSVSGRIRRTDCLARRSPRSLWRRLSHPVSLGGTSAGTARRGAGRSRLAATAAERTPPAGAAAQRAVHVSRLHVRASGSVADHRREARAVGRGTRMEGSRLPRGALRQGPTADG